MRRVAMAWTLLACAWAGPRVALAGCPRFATRIDLQQAADEAMDAFRTADQERFDSARMRAFNALQCMTEALEPVDAGRFHGLMALHYSMDEDDAGIVAAFRASLATGAWAFPGDFVPPDHPLVVGYGAALTQPGAQLREVRVLRYGQITVDGLPVPQAPSDRPCILQELAFDGSVRHTAYVEAAGSLPDWATPPVVVPLVPEPPPPTMAEIAAGPIRTRPPTLRRVALCSVTALTAGTAGVLYAAAWNRHGAYVDPATPYADLDRLDRETSTYTWTALGVGVGALGLTAATVFTW